MGKGAFRVSDFFSALYMVFMAPFVFFTLLADLMSIVTIPNIMSSGFANTSNAVILWPCVFIFGISFLVPGLRRMYYRLPWFEPFMVMLIADSILLIEFYEIFNTGYKVASASRHFFFTLLALLWLIGGRLLMCLWFKKHPVTFAGREKLS